MQRDLGLLRRWAAAVGRDAAGRLGGTWAVVVDDAFVLDVSHDGRREQVLLGDLADEDAFPAWLWDPPHRESTLDAEASEVVAGDFLEVLRLWDVTWPPCVEHGQTLVVCCGTWLCNGPPLHELSLLGELPALVRSAPTT